MYHQLLWFTKQLIETVVKCSTYQYISRLIYHISLLKYAHTLALMTLGGTPMGRSSLSVNISLNLIILNTVLLDL